MLGLGSTGPEQASVRVQHRPVLTHGPSGGASELSEVAELSAKAETQIPPGQSRGSGPSSLHSNTVPSAQGHTVDGAALFPATRGGELARP